MVLLYPAIRHTAGILLEGFAFIMLTCKGNETCSPGLFLNVEPLFSLSFYPFIRASSLL